MLLLAPEPYIRVKPRPQLQSRVCPLPHKANFPLPKARYLALENAWRAARGNAKSLKSRSEAIPSHGRGRRFNPYSAQHFEQRLDAVSALKHVGADVNNAAVDHAEGARGFGAEIEHATAIERAAIVDCYDDAAAGFWICYANTRAKRQGFVRRCEPGAATGIVGGHAEERVSTGLSGLRMERRDGDDRRQKGDCPTVHVKTPTIESTCKTLNRRANALQLIWFQLQPATPFVQRRIADIQEIANRVYKGAKRRPRHDLFVVACGPRVAPPTIQTTSSTPPPFPQTRDAK
jgi:hypothetical protein